MLDAVVEFEGSNGVVEKVKLKNSEDIKADLVIIAVGVHPRSSVYSTVPGLDSSSSHHSKLTADNTEHVNNPQGAA